MLKETPSQTAGPYVHIGCTPCSAGLTGVYPADPGASITADAPGVRIRIEGKIFDGANAPLRDALIELWQPDGQSNAGIWLRKSTDLKTGVYQFDTVKPAARSGPPYVCLWIVARGINLGLHTRMYFPDEENGPDPLLKQAGPRRDTLIATRPDAEEDERDTGFPVYRFDIRLQGERETVFLDI